MTANARGVFVSRVTWPNLGCNSVSCYAKASHTWTWKVCRVFQDDMHSLIEHLNKDCVGGAISLQEGCRGGPSRYNNPWILQSPGNGRAVPLMFMFLPKVLARRQ